MKKLTKILSFAIAFVCLSLCFAGCSFGINQGDDKKTAEKELQTIDIIDSLGSIKSKYVINESLNIDGVKLLLTYSDDSQSEIILTYSMISGFNTSSAGSKIMTITYKSQTKTINYVVVEHYFSTTNVYQVELSETDPLYEYTKDSENTIKYIYVGFYEEDEKLIMHLQFESSVVILSKNNSAWTHGENETNTTNGIDFTLTKEVDDSGVIYSCDSGQSTVSGLIKNIRNDGFDFTFVYYQLAGTYQMQIV